MSHELNSAYTVFHSNPLNGDTKFIGVYSSKNSAEKAVAKLSIQPGFIDSPKNFDIQSYPLNKEELRENSVFLVWYKNLQNEDDVKVMGAYSSKKKAEDSIQQLIKSTEFKDSPENFDIYDYILDQTSWTEGFITWDEA